MALGPAAAIPFEYARGQVDNEGAKLYPVTFDFTGAGGVAQTLMTSMRERGLNTVTSLWIDNSLNSSFFTLTINGTGQIISVAARLQGLYPAFFTPNMINVVALTAGTVKVPVFFINKAIDTLSWLGQ
jgi:hypothetical protein